MSSPATGAPVSDLATALLRSVRNGEETTELEHDLAALDPATLHNGLANDNAKKAVWTDLYNAFAQIPLDANPSLFDDRRTFFSAKRIPIAGRFLSLDDIEHGLLRRSQLKYGLGYLPNLLPGRFEKALRVERRDPRIHFALNCAAASCPPIAAYTPADIDAQLDLASETYLRSAVEYDSSTNVARVPRLCLWYHGDFRGRAGIRSLLWRYGVIPENASPRVRYLRYDWTLDRKKFDDSFANEPSDADGN